MLPPRRSHPIDANRIEGILNGLANLQLGDRQVLADRNEIANGVRVNGDTKKLVASEDIIIISSDNENGPGKAPATVRLPKAMHLARLAKAVLDTTDNVALSRAVQEFVGVLQDSRSRTLTKEGFAFLDALYKQLADPSVYIQPIRTSRPRNSVADQQDAPLEPRAKMNKLRALNQEVSKAQGNKVLAEMVAEFGAVINKSSGRTVTKDALEFLKNLASKLRT